MHCCFACMCVCVRGSDTMELDQNLDPLEVQAVSTIAESSLQTCNSSIFSLTFYQDITFEFTILLVYKFHKSLLITNLAFMFYLSTSLFHPGVFFIWRVNLFLNKQKIKKINV